MAVRDKTKRIATCAMLSALSVVLLYLGSLVEVLDISMAVIASLCCIFAVIEYGGYYPWLIYAVTGVISLLILPQNTAAVIYLLFFGFYPIIKEKLERLRPALAGLFKELIFNACLAVMLLLSRFLLTAESSEPWFFYVIFIVLAEVTFPVYDIALTRIISLYIYKIRARFRKK